MRVYVKTIGLPEGVFLFGDRRRGALEAVNGHFRNGDYRSAIAEVLRSGSHEALPSCIQEKRPEMILTAESVHWDLTSMLPAGRFVK